MGIPKMHTITPTTQRVCAQSANCAKVHFLLIFRFYQQTTVAAITRQIWTAGMRSLVHFRDPRMRCILQKFDGAAVTSHLRSGPDSPRNLACHMRCMALLTLGVQSGKKLPIWELNRRFWSQT